MTSQFQRCTRVFIGTCRVLDEGDRLAEKRSIWMARVSQSKSRGPDLASPCIEILQSGLNYFSIISRALITLCMQIHNNAYRQVPDSYIVIYSFAVHLCMERVCVCNTLTSQKIASPITYSQPVIIWLPN